MMYHPTMILSENSKTGRSLNFPIKKHCKPTKNCSRTCYARRGRTSLQTSLKKQIWVSDYLKGSDISELIIEAKKWSAIRISGTGDLNLDHVPNIIKLAKACPNTQFWGMTRKPEIAISLNNKTPNLRILVSVDSSSPRSMWNYRGKLCYGPRLKSDQVPDDKRIVTVFPYHSSGKVVMGVPRHKKDCRAVYHEIKGCLNCRQCWKW